MSERRARRKRKSPTEISNAHYVGYVEDGESVEAIMKKFEELERLQVEFATTTGGDGSNAPSSAGEAAGTDPVVSEGVAPMAVDTDVSMVEQGPAGALTQEQLEEVFKRTSAFTVRAAQRLTNDDPELLDEIDLWRMEMGVGDIHNDDDDDFLEGDDYVFMDEDYWDEVFGPAALAQRPRIGGGGGGGGGVRRRVQGGNGNRSSGQDQNSIIQRYRTMQVRIQDQQGNYHMIKKKVSTVDPSLPTYVRIPNPIPATWAHRIVPLEEHVQHELPQDCRYVEVEDILTVNDQLVGNKYQAIYMDPPLLLPGEAPTHGKITVEQFASLQVRSLIPYGFLFIWVEKELLARVVRVAAHWGFKYVENFCWIKKAVNNRIVQQPSAHLARSKATMLIFRKEGGEIELRHQRSPDCVFDFIKPALAGEQTEEKPNFSYMMVETMLPGACYSEQDEEAGTAGTRLLELWAHKAPRLRRRGWTSVAQLP